MTRRCALKAHRPPCNSELAVQRPSPCTAFFVGVIYRRRWSLRAGRHRCTGGHPAQAGWPRLCRNPYPRRGRREHSRACADVVESDSLQCLWSSADDFQYVNCVTFIKGDEKEFVHDPAFECQVAVPCNPVCKSLWHLNGEKHSQVSCAPGINFYFFDLKICQTAEFRRFFG